jgi:hypothetical protein
MQKEQDDEVYEAVYSLFNEERVPNLKANALVSLCRIRPVV